MTDRELLTQALEALESSRVFVTTREKIKHPEGTEWYDERIIALRERLAREEQELACEATAWAQAFGAGVKAGQTYLKREEQEPVAWRWKWKDSGWQIEDKCPINASISDCTIQPLYTAPQPAVREWQWLTEKEAMRCLGWALQEGGLFKNTDVLRYAEAIEAKLREKNA